VLPDDEIIHELQRRGTVFRTDLDDPACTQAAAKIGPDADGEAGGCDNVKLEIRPGQGVSADYWRPSG
jgi:hypothetical protein